MAFELKKKKERKKGKTVNLSYQKRQCVSSGFFFSPTPDFSMYVCDQ